MKKKLLSLLKNEAYFKKKVVLSSGKVSNFYIDVRRITLRPEGLYLVCSLIWNIVKRCRADALGGPTLGADPIVGGVCLRAYKNKKPLKGFIVRKSPKKHGRCRMIEGPDLGAKDRVVIVDDVATSGSSLIHAIDVLRKMKIKVVKAVVVVDREEGAKENLSKLNCPLVSLFTKSDILSRK